MSIEKEVNQERFEDEHQKLLINILYTGNWIMSREKKTLRRFNLTLQDYNVLRILNGQKTNPLTVQDITKRMIHKEANVSRVVENLRNRGFVKRTIRERDRRQVNVRITQKGKQLLDSIAPEINEITDSIKGISEEESRQLNHLLDKLREGAKERF